MCVLIITLRCAKRMVIARRGEMEKKGIETEVINASEVLRCPVVPESNGTRRHHSLMPRQTRSYGLFR